MWGGSKCRSKVITGLTGGQKVKARQINWTTFSHSEMCLIIAGKDLLIDHLTENQSTKDTKTAGFFVSVSG